MFANSGITSVAGFPKLPVTPNGPLAGPDDQLEKVLFY